MIAIIGVLVALLIPAVQMAREAARRGACINNLRQIGLALASYESTHAVYPFGDGGGTPPSFLPRWSAHSQLLPFLEQRSVYDALNFSGLPWAHHPIYGRPNVTGLLTQLSVFLCPSDVGHIADEDGTSCNNYRTARDPTHQPDRRPGQDHRSQRRCFLVPERGDDLSHSRRDKLDGRFQ